jgi:hypothetical protein
MAWAQDSRRVSLFRFGFDFSPMAVVWTMFGLAFSSEARNPLLEFPNFTLMNSTSSGTVSLDQLSRMQGCWAGLKHFGAQCLILLCAALGTLPGALVLYGLSRWHEGPFPVLGILSLVSCLVGALWAGLWCFLKCSRVVQGLILANWAWSLGCFASYFLLAFFLGISSAAWHNLFPDTLEESGKRLGEMKGISSEIQEVEEESVGKLPDGITSETRRTEIESAEGGHETREKEISPLKAILYREKDGRKFFYTFQFTDKTHAVAYSGLVGRPGRESTLEGESPEYLRQKLQEEIVKRMTLGYDNCEKGCVLGVTYPITGTIGTPEEWEKFWRLYLFLDSCLCSRGLGGCGGERSYEGNRVLRCFVVDYALAESCIREALENSEFGPPSRISPD